MDVLITKTIKNVEKFDFNDVSYSCNEFILEKNLKQNILKKQEPVQRYL